MKITFSLDEIHLAAQQIIDSNPKKIMLFYGEMGAGKTTLIKAIARKLGVNDTTSSPTFSLVNEYLSDTDDLVYHFDMYRLKNEHEAYDMGMDEYLYSEHWCLIEWPEKIPTLIPHEHSTIKIKALPDGQREVELR
jgi:tRNA threonylcarbamoyladenosine biosynthesis protein TsaE